MERAALERERERGRNGRRKRVGEAAKKSSAF
jgi:hypothetical protein